jgi:hypothetical protein
MGRGERLARPRIATIEKMKAKVQMKTEPRIAPPAARLILKEKCERPGDRHHERRDPRAKPALKVRKKEASLSQLLAHCASKDL